MGDLVKVKAANDFYDDVHYRRRERMDATLCGLKVTASVDRGDVSCLRCRQFATGDF
ncbi:MAG: hypothetical protein ACHQFZ_04380 [Acidimicrobiales bacterium]